MHSSVNANAVELSLGAPAVYIYTFIYALYTYYCLYEYIQKSARCACVRHIYPSSVATAEGELRYIISNGLVGLLASMPRALLRGLLWPDSLGCYMMGLRAGAAYSIRERPVAKKTLFIL